MVTANQMLQGMLSIRSPYNKGDRVRLVHTNDSYTSLQPGDEGTVTGTSSCPTPDFKRTTLQVWVSWDNGSRLAMLPFDGDRIEKI